MRIFVAGGTGVIGRPTVARLVAAGHQVTVLARSVEKAAEVRAMGAVPAEIDLFDVDAVRAAVSGHDAVVNLATHIPPPSRASSASAWAENDRIRTEGSRNLVDAALQAGASVFVQESLAFWYADAGDEWVAPGAPLTGGALIASVQTAEANVSRFAEAGGRGIVLRFGRFYDAASDYSRLQVRAATVGISAEVGAPDGYQPLIGVGDAADAVVAALDAPSGTYDVVDDDPLTRREVDVVVARAVGRKRLHRPLDRLLRRAGPGAEAFTRSMRVANDRLKAVTDWRPSPGGTAAGMQQLVRELGYGNRGLSGVQRVLLWILAVSGLAVGIQALFMPSSFFEDFPFGRGWVATEPPYNEHLIRDVGAFYLALTAVTFVALAIRSLLATRLVALGWFVFSVAHGYYHLNHLSGIDTADAVGIVVGTAGPAVLAFVLLVLPRAELDRNPPLGDRFAPTSRGDSLSLGA
jgi:nucleoside-diphosphate-sugar epimerase